MADAPHSKCGGETRVGSSPTSGTDRPRLLHGKRSGPSPFPPAGLLRHVSRAVDRMWNQVNPGGCYAGAVLSAGRATENCASWSRLPEPWTWSISAMRSWQYRQSSEETSVQGPVRPVARAQFCRSIPSWTAISRPAVISRLSAKGFSGATAPAVVAGPPGVRTTVRSTMGPPAARRRSTHPEPAPPSTRPQVCPTGTGRPRDPDGDAFRVTRCWIRPALLPPGRRRRFP